MAFTLTQEDAVQLQTELEQKLQKLDIPSESIIAEFIIVMIMNGKNKEQIHNELVDSLGVDDFGDLLHWLEIRLATGKQSDDVSRKRAREESVVVLDQIVPIDTVEPAAAESENVNTAENVTIAPENLTTAENDEEQAAKRFKPIVWEDNQPSVSHVPAMKKSTKFTAEEANTPVSTDPQPEKTSLPVDRLGPKVQRPDRSHPYQKGQQKFKEQFPKSTGPVRLNPNHPNYQYLQSQAKKRSQGSFDSNAPQSSGHDQMETSDTHSVTSVSANIPTLQPVECKFGALCMRPDCKFSHPSPAMAMNRMASPTVGGAKPYFNPMAASSLAKIPCKFWPNCLNPSCPFQHGATDNTPKTLMNTTIHCRFDPACKRPDCPFFHPSRQSDDKGISNRVFALDESETEAVPVSQLSDTVEHPDSSSPVHVPQSSVSGNAILEKIKVTQHAEKLGVVDVKMKN